MFRLRPCVLVLSMLSIIPAACAREASPVPPRAGGDAAGVEPAVITALRAQGLDIVGQFDAPIALKAYGGVAGQRPVAAYVSADGQYAVVGTLVNVKGEDVSANALKELVSVPRSLKTWQQLEASHWVVDGKPSAPRVIYTFTDPNCPYCNRFWQAARPWVEAGKVQIRNVMVGVIRADSANKAAAILGAASPQKALEQNERSFGSGGITGLATVPEKVKDQLQSNEMLMMELGFQGTPGILFKDADGVVQTRAGMPQGADMETVLGPR